MGIILMLIALFTAICLLIWALDCEETAQAWVIVFTCVMIIVVSMVLGDSYGSYLRTRTFYDATVEQYRGAITIYEDAAALDIEKAAFTDFVYKDYQDNVAGMILDLRYEIVKYNKKLISKRVMNKSFMFNWLIIAPDKDMKIIRMVERVKIHDQKENRP